ncbi:MAG: siphovirus ReqiPepy6 Gp37-like family protein [Oscillospiraceae bacterium]|nr:siphovirus ReqiPepy6 Gp37-like family protein [Oscillospiraceae bacterium]
MNFSIFKSDTTRFLGVLDCFESLRFRRKYHEPGEFEIHLPDTLENIKFLSVDNLIHRDDIKETGIIEKVSIKDSSLVVAGRLLSCCLDSCYIDAVYNIFNLTYGEVMQKLVENHGKDRYLNPLLNIDNIYKGTQTFNAQISYKNLLSLLVTLSKTSNIGFKVYLDPIQKLWQFKSYIGANRSVLQTMNSPIIFSDEYGNLSGESYIFDKTNYKNNALVLGEGEGESRAKCYIDMRKYDSEPKRYMIVDAKDIKREDGMSDSDYQGLLYNRGLDKLAENAIVENFDADAVTGLQWEYLKNWNLGDMVTIESKAWGISVDKRITEVEEIYEKGVVKIIPTFGIQAPETLNLDSLN